MDRPGHSLVTLNSGVVEIHLRKIDLHSPGSDRHRIRCHDQAHQARLHPVSYVSSAPATDTHQPRALHTVRPLFARNRWGRGQGKRKLCLRLNPFIKHLRRVRANVERKMTLSMLTMSTDSEFGKFRT